MVLGKVYRLSVRKEDNGRTISFLLEHRNDQSEALLFQSGAVTPITANDWKTYQTSSNPFRQQIDGYGCLGVLELSCPDNVHLLFLVLVTGCVSIGKIGDNEIFRVTDTGFISLRGNPQDGERIQEIRRVLNAGTFYFSYFHTKSLTGNKASLSTPLDITLCAQRSTRTSNTDTRFFWNRTLFHHFNRFGINSDRWLLKIMCGGISISTVYVGSKQAKACLFSRLSCERAGTRFNVRGVDDNGHVANFVETEQIIFIDDSISSYVMIRGSVPLFWEQPGINVGSHKVKMSRGSEITQPAYDRHVALLKKRYGRQHFVTLCGSKEGEANLTRLFQAHHKTSTLTKDVPLTAFDYHHYCARGKTDNLYKLKDQLVKSVKEFSFFTRIGSNVTNEQTGTFRVNCVDCLDRTNCVQSFLGLEILEKQLESLNLTDKQTTLTRFTETYKTMWVNNGDHVSRIYAGTGALEGKNKLKDSTLSVARTIQNNLLDSSKQEAMDILLMGRLMATTYADRARSLLSPSYLHLRPSLLKSLCDEYLSFTTPSTIQLTIGTWNVNGGKHFTSIVYKRSDPLSDWLLDHTKPTGSNTPNIMDLSLNDSLGGDEQPSDIFAIGFEEIVDLNASNIVAASTSNQREWLAELQKTISRDVPYVLITSVQLVGVCLFVFVRPTHAKNVRDVLIDQVKTGLGGATGNKGGVSIRMRFYSSTLSFVCAHFAAGQHQVTERNSDYGEITKKTCFPGGRPLLSHDYIFWCGDFNYRIDLDGDYCKDLVRQKDWKTLLAADQLSNARKDGKVFEGFVEGEVNFPPTYKYDNNSDDYDTSEKARIPAWTDRILFGKLDKNRQFVQPPGKIVRYGRAELRTSDHRPVYAVLQVDVVSVDEEKREEVLRHVLESHGPPDGSVLITDSSGRTSGLTEEVIGEILDQLKREAGEIVLSRMTEEAYLIIFRDGITAVKASKLSPLDLISGEQAFIQLKTPNWVELALQDIESYSDSNVVPLYEHPDIIQNLDIELSYDHLGPQVDPNLLVVGDEEDSGFDGSHSGRSSPAVFSVLGGDKSPMNEVAGGPPSRPPPPPSSGAPPKRPPPPPSVSPSVAVDNITPDGNLIKPKPLRPAPPPPQKTKQLTKQVALNPPTITKTCPSTDSEHSFDRGSFDSTTPQIDPLEPVAQDSVDSTDSTVSAGHSAPPDPVELINNAWAEDPFSPPKQDGKTSNDFAFDSPWPQNAPSGGAPPSLPPPPRPVGVSESEDDDEPNIRPTGPPPAMAPPPLPVPEKGPPPSIPSRGAPPPVPSRAPPPVVPPRPPQVK